VGRSIGFATYTRFGAPSTAVISMAGAGALYALLAAGIL
jgi:hypothetical protein